MNEGTSVGPESIILISGACYQVTIDTGIYSISHPYYSLTDYTGQTECISENTCPSATPQVTPSNTPTITPTLSITPTNTTTVSVTPTIPYEYWRVDNCCNEYTEFVRITPKTVNIGSVVTDGTFCYIVEEQVDFVSNPIGVSIVVTSCSDCNCPTSTLTVTPSVTPTQTISANATPSPTPTITQTPTNTQSVTPTKSLTATPGLTKTPTPTQTPSQTQTPTQTPSVTSTPTVTPTTTVTPTKTVTKSPILSSTPTSTQTPTSTTTPTTTSTVTPTQTVTTTKNLVLGVNATSIIAFKCCGGNETYFFNVPNTVVEGQTFEYGNECYYITKYFVNDNETYEFIYGEIFQIVTLVY